MLSALDSGSQEKLSCHCKRSAAVKKHLNICIKIEETVGAIYRSMLKSNRLSANVRETLAELAADEDDHASQLRFALRFPEGAVVNSLPEMLKEAQEMLQQAESMQKKVEQIEVDDQQAISVGVELEKRFCQAHIGNSFEFKEGQLKNMFAAMAKEDERHCQRLLELQQGLS